MCKNYKKCLERAFAPVGEKDHVRKGKKPRKPANDGWVLGALKIVKGK